MGGSRRPRRLALPRRRRSSRPSQLFKKLEQRLTQSDWLELAWSVTYYAGVRPDDVAYRTPEHELAGGVRMAVRRLLRKARFA